MLMTQVFRWSALAAGVLYGAVHRNTLFKQAEDKQKQAEYAHKEQLIQEAKAEYQKKKNGHNESSTIPSLYYDENWLIG
jgi:F-type H+-transporting ATP synthase subunit e